MIVSFVVMTQKRSSRRPGGGAINSTSKKVIAPEAKLHEDVEYIYIYIYLNGRIIHDEFLPWDESVNQPFCIGGPNVFDGGCGGKTPGQLVHS